MTAGSFTATCSAFDSCSTTGFGVPLGAHRQLVRVLPSYRQPAEVWAVSPVRLSTSGKVRVCVRYLQERLQEGEFALREPASTSQA